MIQLHHSGDKKIYLMAGHEGDRYEKGIETRFSPRDFETITDSTTEPRNYFVK